MPCNHRSSSSSSSVLCIRSSQSLLAINLAFLLTLVERPLSIPPHIENAHLKKARRAWGAPRGGAGKNMGVISITAGSAWGKDSKNREKSPESASPLGPKDQDGMPGGPLEKSKLFRFRHLSITNKTPLHVVLGIQCQEVEASLCCMKMRCSSRLCCFALLWEESRGPIV